ncbi:hypothetical protein GCM10009092_38830 [Bowmanella denitrificans]|uniref:DUF805 domain-containing protein n=1 Tax=Bowmanella denitrificans TaxID=366582 RepID=A0ABN0XR57_9ALTE
MPNQVQQAVKGFLLFLFRFDGELNRRYFWLHFVLAQCLILVAVIPSSGREGGELTVWSSMLLILGTLAMISAWIRRLRDIGWTLFTLVLMLVPYLNLLLWLVIGLTRGGAQTNPFGFLSRISAHTYVGLGMLVLMLAKLGSDMAPTVGKNLPSGNIGTDLASPQTTKLLKPSVSEGQLEFLEFARHELESNYYQHGPIYYKTTGSLAEAQVFFARRVKHPKLVMAIPRTEQEIRKIYGSDLSPREVALIQEQMQQLERQMQTAPLQADTTSGPLSISTLNRQLENEAVDTLILVGHSNDEGVLLPSGEMVNLPYLINKAMRHGKQVLVLSCNSQKLIGEGNSGLVSVDRLEFEAILAGLHQAEIMRCRNQPCSTSMGEYLAELDKGIATTVQAARGKKTVVIATLSGSVMVTGVYLINEERE